MMESEAMGLSALVVDDESLNLRLMEAILRPLNLDVTLVDSGLEAQRRMGDRTYDLLLFDIMMPDLDGLELTRWAKKEPRYKDVPVLILTSLVGKETLIQAFEAGAVDFLTKPFHPAELVYRVQAQLRFRMLQKRMEHSANALNIQVVRAMETEAELIRHQEELALANQTLAEWGHRDRLTGLWNRRKAWDLMEYESHRSNRRARPMGVAMLDIDGFKGINDTLGHHTGDQVLRQTASVLEGSLRKGDILARWGGEEFLAVFPETDLTGTRVAAEKLRSAIEENSWSRIDCPKVTVSVGVSLKNPGVDWDPVLKEVDTALYRAKEGGRNQVALYEFL